MAASTPYTTDLPIVQPPSVSAQTHTRAHPQAQAQAQISVQEDVSWTEIQKHSQPEPAPVPHGVMAPMPSPIIKPEPFATVGVPVEQQEKKMHRKILFVYPPGIDQQLVYACYKLAEAEFIKETDKLTIIWAGGEKDEACPREVLPSTDLPRLRVIKSNVFDEVKDKLQVQAPFFHHLVNDTKMRNHEFEIKLEPHAGIRWLLQQELFDKQGGRVYDFVMLPCLRQGPGVATDLEKFLLAVSPCPIALLRVPS